jgi:tRNA G18 (ribose-2'-O)-methylase SpoU
MLNIECRRELRTADPFANVIDEYKGMNVEQVRAAVDARRSPFITILQNTVKDFNLGAVIRGSNAFACRAVVIAGLRSYDRRGAVGTQNYETIIKVENCHSAIDFVRSLDKRYEIVAAEVTPESRSVYEHTWNPYTALVMGEEGVSLSDDVIAACDLALEIPMYGSVRSLNLAAAAQICMSSYRAQVGEWKQQ